MKQVFVAPTGFEAAGFEAAGFDAAAGRGVLFEQMQRQATQDGEVLGGTVKEFALPATRSSPEGITRGPDGALWFTEFDGNRIGRISPSGNIIEYAIPTANSDPIDITSGPDGNLWFAERNSGQIGRITP